MCKKKPDRIGIIAEGDSWFAYPRKLIFFGADSNIIHHLENKVSGTDSVNLLRLESNGDEAVNMTSGKQFKKLYKILKRNRRYIKILMFSGGGNDIVGKNDMLPLLNEYEDGFEYLDCINTVRFEEKLDAIILAYKKLLALCEDIIPDVKVVTHTYDIVEPWNKGGEFLWGLITTKPWVYPYLMKRRIPEHLHLAVIRYMLEKLKDKLVDLESNTGGRLVVVNTQGTLTPGNSDDWLNEIHPTSQGFKKIYDKIYDKMRTIEPGLPS